MYRCIIQLSERKGVVMANGVTVESLAAHAQQCRAKAAEYKGPCAMKRYWEKSARESENLLKQYAHAAEQGYTESRVFQRVGI